MKSLGHQFSNDNKFYLRFLSCTILPLTIFVVFVNHSVALTKNVTVTVDGGVVSYAAKNPEEESKYNAAVSTFTMSYTVSVRQSIANMRIGL